MFDTDSDPLKLATDLHLLGERKGGSETTNSYSNAHSAFHITFYETLKGRNRPGLAAASRRAKLKIGRLYDKPGSFNKNNDFLAFRQSSFTVSHYCLLSDVNLAD